MSERFDWAREDILVYLRLQPREALQRVVDGKLWTTHSSCNEFGERCLVGHVQDCWLDIDGPYSNYGVNFPKVHPAQCNAAYRAFDLLGDQDLAATVAWVKAEAAKLLAAQVPAVEVS